MMHRPTRNALELGAALRDARQAQGWSQAHLAHTAGVSRQLVVEVERGKRPGVTLSSVLAVTRALNLGLTLTPLPDDTPTTIEQTLDELLGGER